LFSYLPANSIEYIKTIARWLLGRDTWPVCQLYLEGQRKSIMEILRNAAVLLPNSESNTNGLIKAYPQPVKYLVIPNGADQNII
jgi:hypothetical protein